MSLDSKTTARCSIQTQSYKAAPECAIAGRPFGSTSNQIEAIAPHCTHEAINAFSKPLASLQAPASLEYVVRINRRRMSRKPASMRRS